MELPDKKNNAKSTEGEPKASVKPIDASSPLTLSEPLDWRIFLIVCVILLTLMILLVTGMIVQWKDYHAGISTALQERVKDHAAILSYSRAMDAAVVKTSSLFLGYLLVFTGALYVLRSANTAYQLAAQGKGSAVSLQTTSPGLVIITLGVVLIMVTILSHGNVDYEAPSSEPADVENCDKTNWQPVESKPSLPTTIPPSERKK